MYKNLSSHIDNKAMEVDVILMERIVLNEFDTKHSNVIMILYLFNQL